MNQKNADGGEDRKLLTGDFLLILLLGHRRMKSLPAPPAGEGFNSSSASDEIRLIVVSPAPAPDVTSRIFPRRVEADPRFTFTSFI